MVVEPRNRKICSRAGDSTIEVPNNAAIDQKKAQEEETKQ
jgi:hypothetical protein